MYMVHVNVISPPDESSDLEACKMLTTNAKNLMSTTSEALYHTQSASIRVAMATRKELSLTHVSEADPVTSKQSQHDLKVRG